MLLTARLGNGTVLSEGVAAHDRLALGLPLRQFTLQSRNLAFEIGHSFLTLTEVRSFDAGTWRAPVLGSVGSHVGGSVTHGYAPVTGYAASVTTGYVTR